MKRLSTLIFLLICFSLSAFAQREITGRVVEIIDAKTVVIEVSTGGKITAELQYIEVPEPEQPLYQTTQDHLKQIVAGRKISFKPRRLMLSKTVGQIFADGVDISQQMIRDGAAWYAVDAKDAQSSEQNEIYRQTEAQAKVEKLGIWSIENLKPAWQVRAERVEDERQQEILAQEKIKKEAEEARARETKLKAQKVRPVMQSESKLWSSGDPDAKLPPNYSTVGGLIIGYDAQTKIGIVITPALRLETDNYEQFQNVGIGIGYFYSDGDETHGRRGAYLVGIEAEPQILEILKDREVFVTAGKRQIVIGKPKVFSRPRGSSNRGCLIYEVKRDVLNKITAEKNVEVKIGKYVGKMSSEMQLLLQNLMKASE